MNSITPSLREMQQWLRYTLTDSRGIEGSLSDAEVAEEFRSFRERPKIPRTASISQPAAFGREARLGIYANAYYARLCDILAANLEHVANALGENDFRYWVGRFLAKHPSRTEIVDELSQDFAEFLMRALPDSPLGTLATLEAAQLLVAFAPLAPPLAPEKLAWLADEEKVENLKFGFTPAHRRIQANWDLAQVWEHRMGLGRAEQEMRRQDSAMIVYRTGTGIHLQDLTAGQDKIYDTIAEGLPLGEICNRLFSSETEGLALTPTFGDWLQKGILAEVHFSFPEEI